MLVALILTVEILEGIRLVAIKSVSVIILLGGILLVLSVLNLIFLD